MNDNYQLANKARKELKLQALRRDILVSEGEKALDMILEAPSPATLVQSFPDQDLYYLMHKVGIHDFLPVLAMAASSQWEYILDVEVWDDDRLDLAMMTQVFSLLFKADPHRLLRWAITQKPEFIEYFLFRNMQVVIREHDELPPEDFDDYITLDDKFYFRFPDREKGSPDDPDPELLPQDVPRDGKVLDEAPELIEQMLKSVAEMDLSVLHGLLLETSALLPSETEEEEFRLKNIRLAEKGFLPAHEAVGIYQSLRDNQLRQRFGTTDSQEAFNAEMPMPPAYFTQYIKGQSLFAQTLEQIVKNGELPGLDSEVAALINKIIAADRIQIRDKASIEKPVKKMMAYLSLGLESLMPKGKVHVKAGVDLVKKYYIEDIFRTGARHGQRLQARVKTWHQTSFIRKEGLPLSFLGETFLGVIGGLLIQRPMFFANYADKELYREFESLSDIRATRRMVDEIICLDDFLNSLSIDLSTYTRGVLTYKSMILTLWARARMGLNPSGPDQVTPLSLAPIDGLKFIPFFAQLFCGTAEIADTPAKDMALWAATASGILETDLPVALQGVLYELIREVESEYGSVDVTDIDPRFMPLFLLENQDEGI